MEHLCPWESPQYLILSSNAPNLFYYSHFVALFVAIVFIYILSKNIRSSLTSKILVFSLTLFSLWSFLDMLLWASNRPDLVLFYWSLQILLEMFIYASSFYLAYVFIRGSDAPFYIKLALTGLVFPIIVLLPTTYLLPGIDVSYCDAIESSLVIIYTYSAQILLILSILFITLIEVNKKNLRRNEIILFSTGLIIYLLAFSSGNIIGSLTENWTLAQVGLFGMPIFISFLSYVTVKFNLFNLKIFGSQVLVVVMWILVSSLLVIRSIENIRVITSITLIFLLITGIQLIRTVKREITLREDLELANKGQANLLHVVNHQIKGYFSKSRNIFAELISDEVYHANNERSKPMLEEGFNSLTEGVEFVREFLDKANIERGQYVYKMDKENMKDIVSDVANEQKKMAEKKGLGFELSIGDGNFDVMADKMQLSQAVKNLIDNAINYTPHGEIKAALESRGSKVVFSVKDNGVGISDELKPRLFTEGAREKDSIKININSTGFGLSFVKEVVLAHKGRVWAESEGRGKGSTFYMELPLNS